jgi:malate dehydrogenase
MSVFICLNGEYGIGEGLTVFMPIRCTGSFHEIVKNVPVNAFSRAKIDASVVELNEERKMVNVLIG